MFLGLGDYPPETFLGDFGLTARITDRGYFDKAVGTRIYCAPELLRGSQYNQSVDMWAFGVSLYFMLTGRPPFPTDPYFSEAVMAGQYDTEPLQVRRISEEACDLIRILLMVNPEHRLSADAAKRHPFFLCWSERDVKEQVKMLESAIEDAQGY
jgi:serine/threonine protein kinase